MYASPDKVEQTEYALNISVGILSRFEELFGLTYPLPKLGTLLAIIPASKQIVNTVCYLVVQAHQAAACHSVIGPSVVLSSQSFR